MSCEPCGIFCSERKIRKPETYCNAVVTIAAALIIFPITFYKNVFVVRYTPVSLSAVSGSNSYSVPGLGESPCQSPAKVPAADDVDAGAALHDLVVLRRGERAAAGAAGYVIQLGLLAVQFIVGVKASVGEGHPRCWIRKLS